MAVLVIAGLWTTLQELSGKKNGKMDRCKVARRTLWCLRFMNSTTSFHFFLSSCYNTQHNGTWYAERNRHFSKQKHDDRGARWCRFLIQLHTLHHYQQQQQEQQNHEMAVLLVIVAAHH